MRSSRPRLSVRRALVVALSGGALLLAACAGGATPDAGTEAPRSSPTATAAATARTAAAPASTPASASTVPPPRADGLSGAPVPERSTQSSSFDVALVNAAAGTFPPLDFPRVVSGSQAGWLLDDDLVLGAVQNGEARAYPLFMMTLHHVANDVLGGEPYLVTF